MADQNTTEGIIAKSSSSKGKGPGAKNSKTKEKLKESNTDESPISVPSGSGMISPKPGSKRRTSSTSSEQEHASPTSKLETILTQLIQKMDNGFEEIASQNDHDRGYGYDEYYQSESDNFSDELEDGIPARKQKMTAENMNKLLQRANLTQQSADDAVQVQAKNITDSSCRQGDVTDISVPVGQASSTVKTPTADADSRTALQKAKKGLKGETATCDSVDQELAEIINCMAKDGIDADNLKTILSKYCRPENTNLHTKVWLNSLVWDNLNPNTRSQDMKLQKVQGPLVKGTIVLAQMINTLVSPSGTKDAGELVAKGMDGLCLLMHANTELNMARRELITPDLKPEYNHLCSPSVPATDQLFGEDVSKQVHEMTEVNRVGKKLGRAYAGRGSRRGYRGRPYYHGSNWGHYRGRGYNPYRGRPFLGNPYRGQSQYPPKRGGGKRKSQ